MRYVLAWDSLGNAPDGWGSHVMLLWRDFEPSKGQYNFALVEKALAAKDRPCYLQLGFSMYDKAKQAPTDYTPNARTRRIALSVTGGVTGYVPDYSAAWVDAYLAAQAALLARYREHPRVAGYWISAGWNQETQAAVDNGGGPWAKLLKPLLKEDTYLTAIDRITRGALAAAGTLPVYLPGAPKPGALWGHNRRDVIADLLAAGARYMNCALLTDNDTSCGVGGHAGKGLYDIATPGRVGFEEGPRKAAKDAGEVYWLLLRARHWRADFLCVYASISAPQLQEQAAWAPTAARWIVFRDAEYPAVTYTGADGTVYGHAGEPGCWGAGLTWLGAGRLRFDKARYDWGRWRLDCAEPLTLAAPGLADGVYRCAVYHPDGEGDALNVEARGERVDLPAGAYHRIDLFEPALEPPQPDPLPTDEARPTLTALRWWLEEEARQREAGHAARADAILYANIELAYRLEGVNR